MVRPKLTDQLSVIRVRKQYAAPYLKYKYVYLKPKNVKSIIEFKRHMKEIVHSWPPGEYYLKLVAGSVFVRFIVFEGKVRRVITSSPATGKPYPILEFFRK